MVSEDTKKARFYDTTKKGEEIAEMVKERQE